MVPRSGWLKRKVRNFKSWWNYKPVNPALEVEAEQYINGVRALHGDFDAAFLAMQSYIQGNVERVRTKAVQQWALDNSALMAERAKAGTLPRR